MQICIVFHLKGTDCAIAQTIERRLSNASRELRGAQGLDIDQVRLLFGSLVCGGGDAIQEV